MHTNSNPSYDSKNCPEYTPYVDEPHGDCGECGKPESAHFWGACGVSQCARCLPLFDANNQPIIPQDNIMYHVKCNWQPRHVTYGAELPASARAKFDYLTDDELADRSFVQYRGEWYDMGEFQLAPPTVAALGFNGYVEESAFSAVAVQYFDADGNLHDGGDSVVVGYIHW